MRWSQKKSEHLVGLIFSRNRGTQQPTQRGRDSISEYFFFFKTFLVFRRFKLNAVRRWKISNAYLPSDKIFRSRMQINATDRYYLTYFLNDHSMSHFWQTSFDSRINKSFRRQCVPVHPVLVLFVATNWCHVEGLLI